MSAHSQVFTDSDRNVTANFYLDYKYRGKINEAVAEFTNKFGVDFNALYTGIQPTLDMLQIRNLSFSDLISSSDIINRLVTSAVNYETTEILHGIAKDTKERNIYFLGDGNSYERTNLFVDILQRQFRSNSRYRQADFLPSLVPDALKRQFKIIVYQTRNVATGGTVALDSLFEALQALGFNALRCGDGNHGSPECTELTGLRCRRRKLI
jgi:hypothetical protein